MNRDLYEMSVRTRAHLWGAAFHTEGRAGARARARPRGGEELAVGAAAEWWRGRRRGSREMGRQGGL